MVVLAHIQRCRSKCNGQHQLEAPLITLDVTTKRTSAGVALVHLEGCKAHICPKMTLAKHACTSSTSGQNRPRQRQRWPGAAMINDEPRDLATAKDVHPVYMHILCSGQVTCAARHAAWWH